MAQRQRTKKTPVATPRDSARVAPSKESESNERDGSFAWRPAPGQPHYVSDATWIDLDEHVGVLKLHERFAHLMLSLYVLVPSAGVTTSWWTTADGSWVGAVLVGLA
jgi:hypothetical protein